MFRDIIRSLLNHHQILIFYSSFFVSYSSRWSFIFISSFFYVLYHRLCLSLSWQLTDAQLSHNHICFFCCYDENIGFLISLKSSSSFSPLSDRIVFARLLICNKRTQPCLGLPPTQPVFPLIAPHSSAGRPSVRSDQADNRFASFDKSFFRHEYFVQIDWRSPPTQHFDRRSFAR